MRGTHVKERILEVPGGFECFQSLVGAPESKRRFVAEHVRAQPGDRILDLGSGTGAMRRFLPHGVTYVGVEIDAGYVARARSRFGELGTFVCEDLTKYEPTSRFDVVLAYGVMHHLDDDAVRAACEVADRALDSDGRVLFAEPCRTAGQGSLERAIMSLDRGRHIRTVDRYKELIVERFGFGSTEIVANSYRIPYTMVILEARR